ncbi:MAG: hypothetical protein JWN40_1531 [Phycisphaerales bacterium]|nr:hypothetical protein [Phycisphaerales bacterium]
MKFLKQEIKLERCFMKLAWIGSAALALGVSAMVPSFASADSWRRDNRDNGRVQVRIERDRVDHYRDNGRYDDRFRNDERFRDFDRDISLRDVPRNVLDTLNCEVHGRVGEVQYVHRDGKFFYRFQVDSDGRRGADASVRIGENGRLLSVEEAAQCDVGFRGYRR